MWPPESGLLSLGRQGVANDDGRHLPALPIFAGVLFNWNVLSSCLSCLGNSRMAHGRFLPRQRDPILVWQQTIVAQPLCLCKTCFRFPHPPSKIVEFRQGLHHLLNALKQSLRRTPTTTTHRQAPRKTIINLGRRAIEMRCGYSFQHHKNTVRLREKPRFTATLAPRDLLVYSELNTS